MADDAPADARLAAQPDPIVDDALEHIIEARVAARASAQAWRWRLRLVAVETATLGVLVAAAGLIMGQPWHTVLRAALIVAASCLASGVVLVGLSAGVAALCSRVRRQPAEPRR
jgi:hypothetical protein